MLLHGTGCATCKANSPSVGQEIRYVLRNHGFFTAFPIDSPEQNSHSHNILYEIHFDTTL